MSRHNLKPLSEVMKDLKEEGFEKDFAFKNERLFILDQEDKNYDPKALEIEKEYRFEGDSDPGMMTILYALKTNDGVKGTISNAYGANTDQDLAAFMRQVKHS
ncbi:MAG: phosphoribosylpyrophosphate synthetase [Candidatus Cyclobacteriaceae bacterium M2_1C_046]